MASSWMGGGADWIASIALLVVGEGRTILLGHLLLSVVVLHFGGRFRGLEIAG